MAACAAHVKATCGRRCILLMRIVMAETNDEKKARLAQALRDNLRRRKAQSREAQNHEIAQEGAMPPPPAEGEKD